MSAVHLHLIITHFPITGLFFAAALLLIGFFAENKAYAKAGLYLVIFCALCTAIAYFSGENAEDIADKFDSAADFYLEQHEDAAKLALIAGIVSGVFAVATLIFIRKADNNRKMLLPVLAVVLVSLALFVRTGNLGGQIRHTEIRENSSIATPVLEQKQSEKDDD